MTDSRLELVRRSYAAWSAGDVDAATDVWHPDCEWDMGMNAAAASESVFRVKDGLVLRVTQTDDPPPGWEDAAPVE